MSVGSDGRREQVLRTDMDNALIFESTGSENEDEANRSLLLQLAEKVVSMMVECGFSRCQGGVMASNPRWCRTDREWSAEVRAASCDDPDSLLRGLILFDSRHVAGEKELCLKIRKEIFDTVRKEEALKRKLAEFATETPPPLNFFGKFIVEKKGGNAGEFDIKARGLAPLRDAARVLALDRGLIRHYSTGGRFEEIREKVPEMEEVAKLAYEAYDFLLRLRTLTGLRRGDSGRFIQPGSLSKLERSQLSNVFDVVRMVQQSWRSAFRIEPMRR